MWEKRRELCDYGRMKPEAFGLREAGTGDDLPEESRALLASQVSTLAALLSRMQTAAALMRRRQALDVHFISSLPVRQWNECKFGVDRKPVQMVWAGDSTTLFPSVAGGASD